MATQPIEQPGLQGGQERPKFLATPERVSQYLELKTEEVAAQMQSVEGRQKLFDELMKHQTDIEEDHEDFHPERLREQLDAAGETIGAYDRYLKEVQAPEKKGMFSRAWEYVRGFPKNHPIVTALLAAAAVAGSIAAGFYFTGNWEMLMTSTGLSKILGGAEAAGELVPPTPITPELPGGGVFEIPPPTSPPDIGGPI